VPRTIDAAGARALLREGGRLFLPGCTGEPTALHGAVAADTGCAAQLAVLTSFVSGLNPLDCPLLSGAREAAGLFLAPAPRVRRLVASYFGLDDEIRRQRPDLVFVPVSRPDGAGGVTLGLSAEFVETALACATVRVAVISAALPALAGAPRLPLDAFTHAWEDDTPPPVLAAAGGGGEADVIAERVSTLIDDGMTLQTGIGKVPSALLPRLVRRRRLRIHSGIVTGAVRALAEAGALDPLLPVTAATLAGDGAFYRWLDGRRGFSLQPIRRTHHPATLAGLDRLMAVNSALEVDLLGQVNAEWAGPRAISAAGGLPDFAAAASRSPGGASIVALPATGAAGRLSRIVPRLAPGRPVSLARHHVDLVVTEYGIADLRGGTAEERALALAAVAAPPFRAALRDAVAGLDG
jgi:acyl-CoA hydrolase